MQGRRIRGTKTSLGGRKINSFLREHCTENISRSDLGKIFEIAPGYVSELCKKHTGISLSDVKLKYQLEHAENLLLNSRLSVDEIAYESGFSSSKASSRC